MFGQYDMVCGLLGKFVSRRLRNDKGTSECQLRQVLAARPPDGNFPFLFSLIMDAAAILYPEFDQRWLKLR